MDIYEYLAIVALVVVGILIVAFVINAFSKGKRSASPAEDSVDSKVTDTEENVSEETEYDDAEEDEPSEDKEEDSADSEENVVAFEATVTAKNVEALKTGTNLSLRSVEFIVTFASEEGKETVLPVTKAQFDKLNEGDKGTLVIIDGKLFDFGEGEDVE